MRICVFCSAKRDFPPQTLAVCKQFGQWLGTNGHKLVYGGAKVGLMGLMADEVLSAGGEVEGYLPRDLFPEEVPHSGIQKLVVVDDLFERKRGMMENSDCFVILPGGVGTLDEFFEVLTWKSLQCFDKPILLFNYEGFWSSLLALFDDLQSKKVLPNDLMKEFKVVNTLSELERACAQ